MAHLFFRAAAKPQHTEKEGKKRAVAKPLQAEKEGRKRAAAKPQHTEKDGRKGRRQSRNLRKKGKEGDF